VPLAWALTVEIVFYVLIGLGLSRTRGTTLVWFAASAAYVILAASLHHPKDSANEIIPIYQYSAIPAGSLPFACGALVWHYQKALHQLLGRLRIGDARLLVSIRWAL